MDATTILLIAYVAVAIVATGVFAHVDSQNDKREQDPLFCLLGGAIWPVMLLLVLGTTISMLMFGGKKS